MINKAKTIAKYMVEEGTESTTEGNYVFYIEEIASHFQLFFEEVKEMSDDILEYLETMEEVAMCSLESDNSFYVTFYTGYCPNCKNEEEL